MTDIPGREIPIVAERSALLFIDVQNYNARPDGGNYKNQVQMPGK
jgi:nicotinamidase-related amidase